MDYSLTVRTEIKVSNFLYFMIKVGVEREIKFDKSLREKRTEIYD